MGRVELSITYGYLVCVLKLDRRLLDIYPPITLGKILAGSNLTGNSLYLMDRAREGS
ncbi:hypothetical protein BMG523Draft_04789 [Frankia sp. BMG5.23]|nr:hypothetical protein BMG523Draft_04789 [Frankia sp. BMG5.23]